jgi:hypothetical protein
MENGEQAALSGSELILQRLRASVRRASWSGALGSKIESAARRTRRPNKPGSHSFRCTTLNAKTYAQHWFFATLDPLSVADEAVGVDVFEDARLGELFHLLPV